MFSRTSHKRWTDAQDSCLFRWPFLSEAHLRFDCVEGSRLSLSHAQSWVPVFSRTSWVLERTSWRGPSVYCVSDTCNLDGPLTSWIKESNVMDVSKPSVRHVLCGSPAFYHYFSQAFLELSVRKTGKFTSCAEWALTPLGTAEIATVPLWSRLMWVSQNSLRPGMLYSE